VVGVGAGYQVDIPNATAGGSITDNDAFPPAVVSLTPATVETTEDFTSALDEALKRKGIRLIHCKTDVEQISNATTIAKLREKAKA